MRIDILLHPSTWMYNYAGGIEIPGGEFDLARNPSRSARITPMPKKPKAKAREVFEHLPARVKDARLVCPLCSASVPVRGLRVKARPGAEEASWYVLFTCPSCGLISEFSRETIDLNHLKAVEGSPWAEALRRYRGIAEQEEQIEGERAAKPRQMIGIAALSMLVWLLLTGNLNLPNLVWGLVVSLVVARLSYRLAAINIRASLFYPARWVHLLALLFEFSRQLVVQNVTLSIRVLNPTLPVRPGIVAIPTRLEGDFELTLLGSLLSLTPDTLAVDIDQEDKVIYLHWIDVRTTEPEEAKKMIVTSMEDRIIGWLHGKEG